MNAQRPIIVGVSRDVNIGINEGVTDHFVVIAGRGFDSEKGLYYYTYYEVGTSYSGKGCDTGKNRFIYNPSMPAFYDAKSARRNQERFDVTQVRPNDGNTMGTINQTAN